ncbi:unnamed protein product, partial [Prorocentrum cordatum]
CAAAEVSEAAWRGFGGAVAATAHLLLELMRSGGCRAPSAAALPTTVLAWIVTTLVWCYWLHRPLTSPGSVLPGISEMGIAPPARGIYRGGSATVGLLLACTVHLYSAVLLPHLAEGAAGGRAVECTSMGYVAAVGVAVQGIFTLETSMSIQTLLHFAGAIAFVLGTMWHADASNALYTDLGDTVPVGLHLWQWARGLESSGRLQNAIGFAQWALVLNFAIFYCTYACDFWVVLEAS